jgi:hypothetical protein
MDLPKRKHTQLSLKLYKALQAGVWRSTEELATKIGVSTRTVLRVINSRPHFFRREWRVQGGRRMAFWTVDVAEQPKRLRKKVMRDGTVIGHEWLITYVDRHDNTPEVHSFCGPLPAARNWMLDLRTRHKCAVVLRSKSGKLIEKMDAPEGSPKRKIRLGRSSIAGMEYIEEMTK